MALSIKLSAMLPKYHHHRSMSVIAKTLKYTEYGEPQHVIKCVEEKLESPTGSQVLVKMLAAPINPADINTIQGKYPDCPKLPAIAGNEGVAEIIECGSNVKNFKVGDRIIPFTNLLGTWRTHALLNDQLIVKIPSEMGIVEAATLTVNPPSAYRMLKDYVDLKKGDTVIQNGANSAVGQFVFQLCRIWGIKCIGIVRNRPNIDELIKYLKDLGATEILTEEQLRTTTIFKSGELPKPKLALNCVGGKSSTEILRHLAEKGVLVTYGAMSREPVTAPNAALIFKDISFRGFWMSRWNKEHPRDEIRFAMIENLMNWYLEKKLQGPVHEMISFDEYKKALSSALDLKGFSSGKLIFDFTKMS